jgi:hypothetical protein
LVQRFTELVQRLHDREPELVRSAAPKRVREALAEAALMTYLRGDKPTPTSFEESGSKWEVFSAPHPKLEALGTLAIDEAILNARLEAQAAQFTNHYLLTSFLGAQDTLAHRISRTLMGAPSGLRKEQLIRMIDPSGRSYKAVNEAIDSLVNRREAYVVTRKTGKRGRPELRIVHRDFVRAEDAKEGK